MPNRKNNLEDLFSETLKDIYFAEKQILRALPKMAKEALSPELKQAFEIGEIANAPITRRADTVKLDGQQPTAIEIATKGVRRGDDQRHLFRKR